MERGSAAAPGGVRWLGRTCAWLASQVGKQALFARCGPVVVRAMKSGREGEGAWKRVEAGGAWADDAHDGRQVELAEAGAVAFTR